MIPERHQVNVARSRWICSLLALLLSVTTPAILSGQPTKDGQPRLTPPQSAPAPAVGPQVSQPQVVSPPAAVPTRTRPQPARTTVARLQRDNRQLAANLEKAASNVRKLQASNMSLALQVNTLRRELLDTGQAFAWAVGLSLALLLLPPLLYLLLIQRRLNDLRDFHEQLVKEHEAQRQDQEALLRTVRGHLQGLETSTKTQIKPY